MLCISANSSKWCEEQAASTSQNGDNPEADRKPHVNDAPGDEIREDEVLDNIGCDHCLVTIRGGILVLVSRETAYSRVCECL